MAASPPAAPGGFFAPSGLLSPTPSQASSSALSSALHGRLARTTSRLPLPRRLPLRPGSAKEDLVRAYMDDRILRVRRRFVKKYVLAEPAAAPQTSDNASTSTSAAAASSSSSSSDALVGYRSMGELCADVDVLVNHLWRSASPRLQVPYFLQLAGDLVTWMDGFAPSPRPTLALLRKLDYCFASLLGAAAGNALSRTDMVRCRSIAEQSRVAVVDVFRRGPPDPLDEAEDEQEDEQEDDGGGNGNDGRQGDLEMANTDTRPDQQQVDPGFDLAGDDNDDDDDELDLQMGVAKVYERTLVKLGETLGDGYARIGDFPDPAPPTLSNEENDDDY